MTKSQKDLTPEELLKSGLGVPPEYFGRDDNDYYTKLIEESDLIEASKPDGKVDSSTEEELFRQIQEDEREEWSDKKK